MGELANALRANNVNMKFGHLAPRILESSQAVV